MAEPPGSRSLGRRLVTNTLHAASGRVVALALWLALTPPILRAIGTEGYALWSFVFALTGYLNAFDLGLAAGTLRHVAAARSRGDERDAGHYATLGLLGYLALGAAWLALTPLLIGPALALLRVPAHVRADAWFAFESGAAIFMAMGATNVCISVAQGFGRFDLANAVAVTSSLAQGAGVVAALGAHAGLRGILVATVGAWAVAFGAGVLVLRLGVPAFRWAGPAASLPRLREMFAFGGWMQVSNVLSVTHQQLDKMLLSRYVAFAQVTPYDLGLRAATAAATVPQLLLLAVLPEAAALHAGEQPARLLTLYTRGTRWVMVAAALVAGALVAAADPLFAAWLGRPEPLGALALRGLALTSAVAMATGMGTSVARGISRTDLEAEFAGVALGVHVALGLALVPPLGMRGALVAILAGNVAGAAWFLFRLSGALRWSRARVIFAPLAVPALAIVLGGLAGGATARALPAAAGVAAWPAAGAAAGIAAVVALGTCLLAGYLPVQDLRGLAGTKPGGAIPGGGGAGE